MLLESDLEVVAFRDCWDKLAADDRCDALDSDEYRRVFIEWCVFGCPADTRDFIIGRANSRQMPMAVLAEVARSEIAERGLSWRREAA